MRIQDGIAIPSLMYCDDTVLCFWHPSAVPSVITLLDTFAKMSRLKINHSKCTVIDKSNSNLPFEVPLHDQVSYLGFMFDKERIVNQVYKFLFSLPSKCHKIKSLQLSPIGMNQFTNSYIFSRTMFWSQLEVYSSTEWTEVDAYIHKFQLDKQSSSSKSFPLMSLHKSLFLIFQGGFNM
eukprot:TRINITY_DN3844_c0_g1_i1.p1 TRINITY_DN3844_c0_g1~~TRINITY_DN3844_c0_g1_i1.p1  ORF type:complete len:179 (-),score=13.70 TRINITY_DN3844_c0_g1_i1:754-1290(-)